MVSGESDGESEIIEHGILSSYYSKLFAENGLVLYVYRVPSSYQVSRRVSGESSPNVD